MGYQSSLPCKEEKYKRHKNVSGEHVDPDFEAERRQEGEETGVLLFWFLKQDGDAEIHERLGEVDHLLPGITDGKWSYSYVSFLKMKHYN